jgi:hypothetical protein
VKRVEIEGAAHLVLTSKAVPLHPAESTFEAMLTGWERQQRSRLLASSTIRSRIDLLRRFATFTNTFPWEWKPGDVEDWATELRSGPQPRAHSTVRMYLNQVAMFCDYLTDPRYGWGDQCEERFGTHPIQICHEGNLPTHTSPYEGRPEVRPLTRSELQQFFDFAGTAFEAISSDPESLKDAITEASKTYAVGIDLLPPQRAFLANVEQFARLMRPGAEDQMPRFLAEGIWENGYEDKYVDLVRSMRAGERIAAKVSYTRKHGLPFDNRGHSVSVMAVKAIGRITENLKDGKRVRVEWTPVDPVREWYFYTHRGTVWRVVPGEWWTDNLIRFAFDGEPQDIDRFRHGAANGPPTNTSARASYRHGVHIGDPDPRARRLPTRHHPHHANMRTPDPNVAVPHRAPHVPRGANLGRVGIEPVPLDQYLARRSAGLLWSSARQHPCVQGRGAASPSRADSRLSWQDPRGPHKAGVRSEDAARLAVLDPVYAAARHDRSAWSSSSSPPSTGPIAQFGPEPLTRT